MTACDREPMRYARPWPALLATLALHLLLMLLVWQTGSKDGANNTQASRLQVRLIAEIAPKPTPRSAVRKPIKQVESAAKPIAVQTIIPPPSFDAPLSTSVVASPALPASAASSAWTDDEQIRRIVQMHAKQVPITEQAALASQAPKKLSSTERLGNQIQSAANGDCLKGEFSGAGMGLLSLPFWAIAEARGKCRR